VASPAPVPSVPPVAAVGFRSERGPILAALMMSMLLVAIDSTIIATAVPSIVRDVGGFTHFPWLFSVYLLTQAVTIPLYGKFADMIGRKPVMIFGIVVFLLGSVLCGFAWNMGALIVFRGLQGVGAGAVQPMAMTIAGDLYTVEERARVQGYLASVWAAASLIGPTLGGVFSEYLSWRWIFFVNLPVGAVALFIMARNFNEKVTRREHRIDYLGAGLLTAGCSLLLLGLLEGGVAWAWGSATGELVLAGALVSLVAFVLVEQRVREPILPLWVFSRRILVSGNLVAVAVGAITLGLSSYVPTFVQGVLGTDAVIAGLTLAALTVGWPVGATVVGRIYVRVGFRDAALAGSAVVLAGAWMFTRLGAASAVWQVAVAGFVLGLGLGLSANPTLVAVQSVVGWERRGVVTATNMFSRSMGSAIGVAVFGAIVNSVLASQFAHRPPALAGSLPESVNATSLALGGQSSLSGEALAFVRAALEDATHHVFVAVFVVAVALALAVALMPRRTTDLVFTD
jgi:EmrB/QacA subfamily drug resistance transporter